MASKLKAGDLVEALPRKKAGRRPTTIWARLIRKAEDNPGKFVVVATNRKTGNAAYQQKLIRATKGGEKYAITTRIQADGGGYTWYLIPRPTKAARALYESPESILF